MNYSCLICNNHSFTVPFDNGDFSVIECSNCKYGLVNPIPSDQELERLYNSAEYFNSHMHYDYNNLTDKQIEKLIQQSHDLHYNNLNNYLGEGRTLLEVGPGGGFSLKAFERLGYNVKGVETSDASVKFAASKLNLDIENVPLEKFIPTRQYDIVMLNHVLEHFVEIYKAMDILKDLVATSGLLYIRVPDHDSYDRRMYGDKWPAYLPFHISYFSEKSLVKLLENQGFTILEIKKYVSEKFMSAYPRIFTKTIKKIIPKIGLTSIFSGRTITVIARKA